MTWGRRRGQASARGSFFVGRRPLDGAEVYAVSAWRVERLESAQRFGSARLDWNGATDAALELAHALLAHAAEQLPTPRLVGRFAADVVFRLPDDGFVIGPELVAHWIRCMSAREDWAPLKPRRRRR